MGASLREAAASAASASDAPVATSTTTLSSSTSSTGALGSEDDGVTRTTHMFSATFPPDVQKLARKYMRNPATVQIGDQDSGKNRRITQEVFFLPSEARKRAKLVEVLERCERPVIIFVNAKKQVGGGGSGWDGVQGWSGGQPHGLSPLLPLFSSFPLAVRRHRPRPGGSRLCVHRAALWKNAGAARGGARGYV
jgi:hypothetical protein